MLLDDLTYKHLTDVVGRHLDAILAEKHGIRLIAWLFPPEEVLGNFRIFADSIVTIVSEAVKTLLILPRPYHYSLLKTARVFHTDRVDDLEKAFAMPHNYEVALSDQIPSERAHDLWTSRGNYAHLVRSPDWAVKSCLRTLEEVAKRLRAELKGQLLTPGRTTRDFPGGPAENHRKITAETGSPGSFQVRRLDPRRVEPALSSSHPLPLPKGKRVLHRCWQGHHPRVRPRRVPLHEGTSPQGVRHYPRPRRRNSGPTSASRPRRTRNETSGSREPPGARISRRNRSPFSRVRPPFSWNQSAVSASSTSLQM